MYKTNVPTVCECFLISSCLSFLFFFPLFAAAPPAALQYQSEGSRPHLSKLDLEQWYQELMAGSSQLCPPPLPAKSLSGRRHVLQVEGLSSLSPSFFPTYSCCTCYFSAKLQITSEELDGCVWVGVFVCVKGIEIKLNSHHERLSPPLQLIVHL